MSASAGGHTYTWVFSALTHCPFFVPLLPTFFVLWTPYFLPFFSDHTASAPFGVKGGGGGGGGLSSVLLFGIWQSDVQFWWATSIHHFQSGRIRAWAGGAKMGQRSCQQAELWSVLKVGSKNRVGDTCLTWVDRTASMWLA